MFKDRNNKIFYMFHVEHMRNNFLEYILFSLDKISVSCETENKRVGEKIKIYL